MRILNCFEHHSLAAGELPQSWRTEAALNDLERFCQNNWEQRSLFYSDGKADTRQQFIDFDKRDGIRTQNYIGTIAYRGGQINIFPKVYRREGDDDTSELEMGELVKDFVNWLSYSQKLNFPFVSHEDELRGSDNLLELLITVYVHYVQAALQRQLYYRYEETEERGSYVKGKIDLRNYLLTKYPSGQHQLLRYTYSNFQFDNALNRIIKSTCSLLFKMTRRQANIDILRNILMRLTDVATADSTPYDCDLVHLNVAHQDYKIILAMSRMFLLNKVSSYTSGDSNTFCFLFPAEVLFEGYIAGVMKEAFGADKVRTQTGDSHLAELYVDGVHVRKAFALSEDILIELEDDIWILDTKYKRSLPLDRYSEEPKLGVSDSDMKQMLVYAVKRGARKLGLIYPLYRGESTELKRVVYRVEVSDTGLEQPIDLEIFRVPFACSGDAQLTKDAFANIRGV